jgi:hypothetical protein
MEMDPAFRFEINSRRVVGEVFDDEVVVVNLENGNYYTLDSVGRVVWCCLQTAPTLDDLVAGLCASYEGTIEEIAASLHQLLETMVVEGVLVQTSAGSNGNQAAPMTVPESSGKPRFVPPVLTKFSDMQDLLLLDPIHDVDEETGWPAKPAPHLSAD